MAAETTSTHNSVYHVLIIGGGVVGLSVLRSATLAGYKCALVEKERDLLEGASGHNSGICCTGVDAAAGTLERALVRDGISQIRPFLRQHNIPNRPCGSLVCQWNENSDDEDDDDVDCLDAVLLQSHNAGDAHATRWTPPQIQEMEPNLSQDCTGAVHIPGEIVLDPWLFSIALAVHARENGATIYTNFEMNPEKSNWDSHTQTWTVSSKSKSSESSSHHVPKVLKAKIVINAAGIHADLVQWNVSRNNNNNKDSCLDPPHWNAQPRRGQYRIFSSTEHTRIQHPIQPVPTQFTKGIFCFSSVYNQIVVGPTALDQSSRTDTTLDANVARQLSNHVKNVLPKMKPDQQHVGDYVGIRPGTNHRDYQIRLYPKQHWIVAAGIRSTGLTASLGIGRHVVHLIGIIMLPPTPILPLESLSVQTTPLPPVKELVKDYHARGNGTVMIQEHVYRVTHPITKLGWDACSEQVPS
jgi:glycerol-3-phosphate dehydrogenase